jgi:hypothetical protein
MHSTNIHCNKCRHDQVGDMLWTHDQLISLSTSAVHEMGWSLACA